MATIDFTAKVPSFALFAAACESKSQNRPKKPAERRDGRSSSLTASRWVDVSSSEDAGVASAAAHIEGCKYLVCDSWRHAKASNGIETVQGSARATFPWNWSENTGLLSRRRTTGLTGGCFWFLFSVTLSFRNPSSRTSSSWGWWPSTSPWKTSSDSHLASL